jgi:pimeloyl-ACP methyl ester carboxylesterase
MARFVLVHGAFCGAWCWEPVTRELGSAGHSVVAIDLPGSGEDNTPVEEVTLDAYAMRICQVLSAQPEPSVLVGHSMGGIAITQAAARCAPQVALLVYVAAFLPRNGQSLQDLAGLPEGADDQVQANMVVTGDPPVGTLSAAAAQDALFGCCSDEQATWAIERMRPQPLIPCVTPVELGGASERLLRTYVVCTRDRAIPPALQRRMVRESPCAEVLELDTDHSPFLSLPSELAAVLTSLASTN